MKRAPRSRQRHDLYAKYHDYDSEISDLLGECGLTAAIRFLPRKTKYDGRVAVQSDLLEFSRRVFREQNLAYEIDSKGGIHPKVDPGFSIVATGLIRNLGTTGLNAAREHVLRAEKSLLAGKLDTREAIRATFDAAENLLKVIFPKATQLNAQSIKEKLGPYLVDGSWKSKLERQASEKLVSALVDWTEAAHFFRHASGGVEQEQPSESFAVAFVSQGFSFIRWIADTYVSKENDPSVFACNP